MAALQGAFHSGSVALTGGTAQTVLQVVAPTNQRLKITKVIVSFDGTNSANTPATVQILRQTTAGTFTNTTVTPQKVNDPTGSLETLQAVGQTVITTPGTGEPTIGDLIESFTLPVFGGYLNVPYTPGQEILVPGGTRLGFKVNAPQAVNANAVVYYEE